MIPRAKAIAHHLRFYAMALMILQLDFSNRPPLRFESSLKHDGVAKQEVQLYLFTGLRLSR